VTLWTIGHSTDAIEVFVAALTAHGIAVLADVRRFPWSRRHPQFGGEALAATLAGAGIDYVHFEELGGRRRAAPDSPNSAWRVDAFRGYADYMETAAFAGGMARLLSCAERPTAIMCAERLWWSCHRALISDWLKSHGHEVLHIRPGAKTEPHPYTSAARIVDGRLSYRGLL
jgi:uncharacterized protein (DUF488 family)